MASTSLADPFGAKVVTARTRAAAPIAAPPWVGEQRAERLCERHRPAARRKQVATSGSSTLPPVEERFRPRRHPRGGLQEATRLDSGPCDGATT